MGFKNFRIRGGDRKVKKYIEDLREQIVRVISPRQVILFGSYAYGQPNEDSDVDLLVVMPFEGHTWDIAAKLRMQLESPMPMDLLVKTPEYVAERIKMGDPFVREIEEQGLVLYEADYAGVGEEGGRRLGDRAA